MMHLGNQLYTPYAPAWYTQPIAKMYEITHEPIYRDLVFEINDRVAKWHELNSQYEVYPDYDGMLLSKVGFFGNVSITAAALESLTDAALVAKNSGDQARFRHYTNVIKHATAFLLRQQYTPENSYYVTHRERVIGGIKTDLINGTVWCDNVWHATCAFIKIFQNNLL